MRKSHTLFVGSYFQYNQSLKNYILRKLSDEYYYIDNMSFYRESDKSIFLHLEKLLEQKSDLFIITSKNSFSVIGKLLCTITSDNQILKDKMLMPSLSVKYEKDSYLLEYLDSRVNVILAQDSYELPPILLKKESITDTIHLFDEDYSSASAMLEPIAQSFDVRLHINQKVEGWLQIDIENRRHGNSTQFIASAKKLLPKNIITSANIAQHILKKLEEKKRKISFAESCSGGLLAYYFTKEAGVSAIFNGSIVSYSNTLKESWLSVKHQTLMDNGAVSLEVVQEMSQGIMNVSHCDYSLSISGIAGPSGATETKGVGTVCIGVRSKMGFEEEQLHFNGDRISVQEQSVFYAVKMLLLHEKEIFFEI